MAHSKAGKNAVPPGNQPGAGGTVASKKPARGRTAQTTAPDVGTPRPTEGKVNQERVLEVNRPIGNGGGKLRGDRQDTHSDPGRRNNERSGLRNDRNPSSTAGRRNNRTPNQGG